MNQCKNCIFSERKDSEFVYCRNFEKSVNAQGTCSKYIIDMVMNGTLMLNVKK